MEYKKLLSTNNSMSEKSCSTKGFETIIPTLMGMNISDLLALKKLIEDRIRPVGIKVILTTSKTPRTTGYCDVIFIMADGSELIVDFNGRPAKVLYVYALMNPKGFRRSEVYRNKDLAQLFSRMFHLPADELKGVKGQALSQSVSQSRTAIRNTVGDDAISANFVFDEYNSKQKDTLVIPFANDGGRIEFINF